MVDCTGYVAGHYLLGGNVVNSTFLNVGGLASDDQGYGDFPFYFSWCVFSNVLLNAVDEDIEGDHNGFFNCSQYSNYNYNNDEWTYGTNYFGSSWYWLTNS